MVPPKLNYAAPAGEDDEMPDDVAGESPDAIEAAAAGWQLVFAEDVVAWDARTGALCGLGQQPGVAPLPEWLRRSVHDEDRSLVAGSLRASATTGRPYRARFRTAGPRPGIVVARGRVLAGPGGDVRVLGFAAEEVGAT